ncbi:MAG TPA: hypothetical protein VIP11_01920 [Gemmatimonadaceae bacterium]
MLVLLEPRILATQTLEFLLRRLNDPGGREPALALGQSSRPRAQLVGPHIQLAPHQSADPRCDWDDGPTG